MVRPPRALLVAVASLLAAGPAAGAPSPLATDEAGVGGPATPVDRKAFRFARSIEAAPRGLAAVELDAGVLARSDLSDLRIVTREGREVPYVLEPRDEPLTVALAAAPLDRRAVPSALAAPGRTLHALSLPERNLPGARLVLETGARVFAREVRVYAEREGTPSRRPEAVAAANWAHADPDRPAPPLSLELPRLAGVARLVVAVHDGDDAPLPLAGRLLLRSYRLRFHHPGPAFALDLLYGADLPAPQYDLALLAPSLRGAAAREVALGPPSSGAEGGPAPAAALSRPRNARAAFWIALGTAATGLLLLVGRLLGRRRPARPSPDR